MDGAWNRRLRGLALAALVFGLDHRFPGPADEPGH